MHTSPELSHFDRRAPFSQSFLTSTLRTDIFNLCTNYIIILAMNILVI